jgi:RNA polymerase sigma factor (TIGR02999 family)
LDPGSNQIDALLLRWNGGDRKAIEAIFPFVYEDLRSLARLHLREQRPNHTLQPTALVHETYVRLAAKQSLAVENRVHFLGIAAQLMRWILADYERSRRAAKRGSFSTRLQWDDALGRGNQHPASNIDLLALDDALSKLAELDRQQSRIVEIRYFGGLSIEEAAEFLGISPATVKRDWASARAWLLREIGRSANSHER